MADAQWIVYTYQVGGNGESVCHAYGSYDSSADAQADVPFTQETATALASNINGFSGTSGVHAMALPLEQTVQPGV
jgi:hypothetical protein